MFRNRIVISPLHEDLMNIGLLPKAKNLNEWVEEGEDDQEKQDMPPAEDDMTSDDSDHDGSEDSDTASDDSANDQDSGDQDSTDSDTPDADTDNYDDQDQYDDGQEDSDDDHLKEKPMAFPPLKMGESRQASRSNKSLTESKNNSISRINNLLEETQKLVNSASGIQRREALKSFANISMISEMLSRGFIKLSNALDEQDLRGVARTFRSLSEESGKVALVLKANRPVSGLDETFKNQMNVMLEGLDLYEDILEACEAMSEEHSEDCDCDDCDAKKANASHDDSDVHHPHVDIHGDNDDADQDDQKDEDLY